MSEQVREPLAFISHSSHDKDRADQLSSWLREHGVKTWIDQEQIRFGDSIPSKIAEGLSQCSVILVLISRYFVESSWCRTEYEPLLMREIESGRTSVIPIRFDDVEMPVLLNPKRYVDLRKGFNTSALFELATQIAQGSLNTVVKRTATDRSYHCSLLSMVIGGVVKDFPVSTMTDEEIVKGRSLIDLYRAVDGLVNQFQNIVDGLLSYASYGDSDDYDYNGQLRKLQDIDREMSTLSGAFDGILRQDSQLKVRLNNISQMLVRIGGLDSGLYVRLGQHIRGVHGGMAHSEELNPNLGRSGLGEDLREEYQRLLEDLSSYRHGLRDVIARASSSE
jgi:hypothetical protein